MSEEAIRKRREREERRAAAARAKALAEGEDPDAIEASGSSMTPAAPTDQRPATPNAQAAPAYTVTLPGSSSDLAWYDPEGCRYESIADAQAAGIWTYPANLHERAKCRVFRDLWEQGNFMGGGIRFGGDFLVYPGAYSCERGVRELTRLRGQATQCATTRTSSPPSSTRRSRRSSRWNLSHTGDWAPRRRRHICSAAGMTRSRKCRTFPSNGRALADGKSHCELNVRL